MDLAGERLWTGALDGSLRTVTGVPVELAPGVTRLRFTTVEPPATVPGDSRALTLALYGLQITLGPPRSSRTGKAAKTDAAQIAYDGPH